MLIILEGQARTGKSTLANAIFEHLKTKQTPCFVHKFKRTPNALRTMIQYILPMAFDDKIHVVDRAHLTEVIFNELLSRDAPFTYSDIIHLDNFLSLGNSLLVLVTCPEHVRMKREVETKRLSEGDPKVVRWMFEKAFGRSVMNKMVVDTSAREMNEVVESILTKLGTDK